MRCTTALLSMLFLCGADGDMICKAQCRDRSKLCQSKCYLLDKVCKQSCKMVKTNCKQQCKTCRKSCAWQCQANIASPLTEQTEIDYLFCRQRCYDLSMQQCNVTIPHIVPPHIIPWTTDIPTNHPIPINATSDPPTMVSPSNTTKTSNIASLKNLPDGAEALGWLFHGGALSPDATKDGEEMDMPLVFVS
eukprot:GEMP01072657.1.p1 GENE.GEMP01072657.1~~GEMP01072657.1.p1  ORF type:complete len:191 (+),score=34.45 GEMP01072657.1:119-691(+)